MNYTPKFNLSKGSIIFGKDIMVVRVIPLILHGPGHHEIIPIRLARN